MKLHIVLTHDQSPVLANLKCMGGGGHNKCIHLLCIGEMRKVLTNH